MPQIKRFHGLNNVNDPTRVALGWLRRADNVDVSNTGALVRRDGYVKRASAALVGAFATRDESRMYVATSTAIARADATGAMTNLTPLTVSNPMHWAEVNGTVFFNNGTDSGMIREDGEVLPWGWPEPGTPRLSAVTGGLNPGLYQACCTFTLPDGRETGAGAAGTAVLWTNMALSITDVPQVPGCGTNLYIATADSTVFHLAAENCGTSYTWANGPESLGEELGTQFLSSLPLGADVIQHWRGRMYVAQYMAQVDQTAVWASEPLGYHLFDRHGGFFMVSGRVVALAPVNEGLIVATQTAIYVYDGEALTTLAPYGMPHGSAWAFDDDTGGVFLWTKRGVCSALPFKNITQDYVSVAPGRRANAALVRLNGEKRLVANLSVGDFAFNPRS